MGEMNIYSSATAKDYYLAGCQFKEAAMRSFSDENGMIINNGQMMQLPAPTVVNGAFACELFLKALVVWENKPVRKEHDLGILFDMLSPETQEGISRFCMPKGMVDYQDKFKALLMKYKNVFVDDRYYAERVGWQNMSPMAIITIAQNLATITSAYVC